MMKRLILAAGVASLALLAGCGDRGGEKAGTKADGAPAAAAAAPAAASASEAELARVTDAGRRESNELTARLLNEAAGHMGRDGYSAAAGQTDHSVPMGQGRNHDWTVNLRGGQSYRIVGVCDFQCENLDLELRDASGAVVASDVLEDDVPIVEISPAADGAYTARFIMKTCTTAPCFASARLFQRG